MHLFSKRKVCGDDDAGKRANKVARLANSYRDLGRRQEAMKLRENTWEAWEASQRVLGSEHPDTFTVMTNVSTIFLPT